MLQSAGSILNPDSIHPFRPGQEGDETSNLSLFFLSPNFEIYNQLLSSELIALKSWMTTNSFPMANLQKVGNEDQTVEQEFEDAMSTDEPTPELLTLDTAYDKHFGKDSNVLVWQGTTQEMNPSIDESVINQALEEDESSARAEYYAEFRKDI